MTETDEFQWENKKYSCVNTFQASESIPRALKKSIKKSKIDSTVTRLKEINPVIRSSGDYIYVKDYKKLCFTNLSVAGSEQTAWINPWICSSQQYSHEIIKTKKVSQIVTGCCLFGDHLIAVDHEGTHFNFNDISPKENSEQTIDHVFQQGEVHAYELMNHSQLRQLLPLMQAISKTIPLVHFHVPVEEYLLKGVILCQCGKLSIETLATYARLVIERGYRHKRILQYSYQSDQAQIQAGSTMSILGLTDIVKKSNTELKEFLQKINLKSVTIKLSSMMCWNRYLKQYPPTNLMSILEISYTMFVAFHSTAAFETAVIDSNTERRICDSYQRIEPALPAILALHWIPAIMPSKSSSWYYAADIEKPLQAVVRSGLFEKASQGNRMYCYGFEGEEEEKKEEIKTSNN